MSLADAPTILACILALLALSLLLQSTVFCQNPLPPGPSPLPLLGNLFDMPVTHEYRTYAEWGEKYGDVVYVNVLGKHVIVLDSADAAKELLDVRSSIYSDRPFIPMLHDPSLMDSNWTFAFKSYSVEWRRQRRLFSHHLSPAASRTFFDRQTSSAHTLLRSMLSAPEQLAQHLRYATAGTILTIAYGYQIQPSEDPFVAIAEYAAKTVGEGALPGRFLVNIFPCMKYIPAWVPGAGFKKYAAKGREAERKHVEMPFEDAKRRMAEGTAPPSFVTSALTDAAPDSLIRDIKAVAATMYGAGADTTSSSMHACVLALVLDPRIQTQAQRELDNVLGPATSPSFRLPTFSDRPDLPYIDAIVKEALRWFPVVPVGIPHATTEEDVYRGWRIPKGAIVIANSWSMLRNEKIYPDPLLFRPERFLGENPAPHPGSQGCFGFGRRECPGRHLAEASLWIQIASLLAVFTLSPTKDKDGRDIDVSYAREPAATLILHPQNFPFMISLRSNEAEMRIRETRPE